MTEAESSRCRSLGVDGILIINVRSFVDRRRNIERQLDSFGLKCEFIHVYDVCDLDSDIVRKFLRGCSLSPGQRSCAMKHFEALRLVVARDWESALVLEDDVILAPDFVHGIRDAVKESSCLDHPHVIFIGSGGNLYTPRSMRVPGQRLYRATKGRLTEAYIVSRQAAQLRIEWIERHGIILPIDALLDLIDREMGIELYWFEEPVAEQGSKNGTFMSTLEPAPPNIVQRIKFRLQKIRRKYLYNW